jgi:hypothetical protein
MTVTISNWEIGNIQAFDSHIMKGPNSQDGLCLTQFYIAYLLGCYEALSVGRRINDTLAYPYRSHRPRNL